MNLEPPVTLGELAADGIIISTAQDFAAAERFGRMTSIEFTTPQPDDPTCDANAEVRIHNAMGETFTVPGIRIAEVADDAWTWLTDAAPDATYQATEEVRAAARTLRSGAMLLDAIRPDNTCAVIALDTFPAAEAHVRQAFIHGLARMDVAHQGYAYRSVLAAASAWELPVREEGDHVEIAAPGGVLGVRFTGTYAREVQFDGALSSADVLADAFYLSQEAQYFFDATGHAATQPVEIARFTETQWRWTHPAIHHFGIQHGLLDLARGVNDMHVVDPEYLTISAKPVLGLWAHRFTERDGYTSVELVGVNLPQLTAEVRDTVLATELPRGVDPQRARLHYLQSRASA
ncbi:Uncharacterised protein [Corynebacterium renale]|uniref:hypothetical protein n=1 Tax=Corynebacterium renale TaxID=1724 RepID=UPI000DA2F5F5|nr:hypothetical protein [Corynebacterium renale]SQG64325.1 Uncharacterised protein [Corynebacterium renale]STC94934.1 Uncharacterised protein [Corynebacterium renale]